MFAMACSRAVTRASSESTCSGMLLENWLFTTGLALLGLALVVLPTVVSVAAAQTALVVAQLQTWSERVSWDSGMSGWPD